MNNNSNIGRKAILVMTGLMLITFLVWFKRIDSNTFGLCFIGSLGAYIAGNVTQKKFEKEKKDD